MIESNEVYWPATPYQPQPEKGEVSPAKVIEVLHGILAHGEHAETGDNEAAPDGYEVEDPPVPQNYIEGDLR